MFLSSVSTLDITMILKNSYYFCWMVYMKTLTRWGNENTSSKRIWTSILIQRQQNYLGNTITYSTSLLLWPCSKASSNLHFAACLVGITRSSLKHLCIYHCPFLQTADAHYSNALRSFQQKRSLQGTMLPTVLDARQTGNLLRQFSSGNCLVSFLSI